MNSWLPPGTDHHMSTSSSPSCFAHVIPFLLYTDTELYRWCCSRTVIVPSPHFARPAASLFTSCSLRRSIHRPPRPTDVETSRSVVRPCHPPPAADYARLASPGEELEVVRVLVCCSPVRLTPVPAGRPVSAATWKASDGCTGGQLEDPGTVGIEPQFRHQAPVVALGRELELEHGDRSEH